MRTCGIVAVMLLLAIGFTAAWASEKEIKVADVPAKVRAAVTAKFPECKIEEAAQEDDKGKTVYELTIVGKDEQADVTATPDGEIVMVDKLIKEGGLPKSVRDALTAKYPDAQLKKVEEISEKEEISYEVLVVTTAEVKFDAHGKVVEVEIKK